MVFGRIDFYVIVVIRNYENIDFFVYFKDLFVLRKVFLGWFFRFVEIGKFFFMRLRFIIIILKFF